MTFRFRQVALVSDTYYPNFASDEQDNMRGELGLTSAIKALRMGMEVIIVDGGSHPTFLQRLRETGACVIPQGQRGMSNGRRQGYRAAFELGDIDVILRMEGEKHPLLMDEWIQRAAEMILSGESDIIVPSRTISGFSSLPPFQRESEVLANQEFNDALRRHGLLGEDVELDSFFGPRIFGKKALPYFLKTSSYEGPREREGFAIRPESYSEALFFPICTALKDGLHVTDLPASHYLHPDRQTAFENGNEEFDKKRVSQRLGILCEQNLLLRTLAGEKTGLALHSAI